MAKKYQPAIFQPTIRPSWSGSLEYINADELAQILKAIASFPNINVPDSAFWNQTVKPDLEQQFLSFKETCESRGRGARTYWGEHKLSLCSTYDNHKDTESITQGNLCKDKDKNKDKDEDKVNDNTLFNAGFQNWVFPVEIKKVAAKHWSAETIREIEKKFSCQEYNTQTCIFDLLSQYPEDKTKRFVKPTVEQIEAYCKERNNRIDPEEFFNHYEGNGWKVGSNSMKDWKAVIRTWEKRDFNRPQQPQRKNWSNYVGEGSFLRNPEDDPFLEDIFNKKD